MAENTEIAATVEAAKQAKKAEKKPRKKHPVRTTIIIFVVLILAGVSVIAFDEWHKQPAFCGTVCHSTMGSYVDNFESGTGLARIHAEANVVCLDCHEPTVSQQVEEAIAQVTGDYVYPFRQKSYGDEMCLKCHISIEVQQAKTDLLEKDPHGSGLTGHQNFTCGNCHKSHTQQVNQCGRCHDAGNQRMISWPLTGHDN